MALRIALALSVVVAFALGATHASMQHAERTLSDTACVEGRGTPPPEEFYAAMRRLEGLSALPWLRTTATERSRDAAAACQSAFESLCDAARDDAVQRARERMEAQLLDGSGEAAATTTWDAEIDPDVGSALCAPWRAWSQWLSGQGLDVSAACPVCYL